MTTTKTNTEENLEKEIDYHISQWNERIDQIRKVAEYKGITLEASDFE